jgi:hypothetical protein
LDAYGEVLSVDESAVAVFLKIEEAGCALDVGKHLRVLLLKKLKPFAADNAELQIPDKLLVMELADPQEVENFFVKVIEDFNL